MMKNCLKSNFLFKSIDWSSLLSCIEKKNGEVTGCTAFTVATTLFYLLEIHTFLVEDDQIYSFRSNIFYHNGSLYIFCRTPGVGLLLDTNLVSWCADFFRTLHFVGCRGLRWVTVQYFVVGIHVHNHPIIRFKLFCWWSRGIINFYYLTFIECNCA